MLARQEMLSLLGPSAVKDFFVVNTQQSNMVASSLSPMKVSG